MTVLKCGLLVQTESGHFGRIESQTKHDDKINFYGIVTSQDEHVVVRPSEIVSVFKQIQYNVKKKRTRKAGKKTKGVKSAKKKTATKKSPTSKKTRGSKVLKQKESTQEDFGF